MNIQVIFTKYQLFASPNIFLQINSYHLGPQNVPPTSCSHQHLGLPTEMFWDQPPQKHCAAVYLKHLGGSTFKSYLRYLRYNVRTSEFSKFWSWFSQPPKVSKIDSNATVPHLAQHAVPPWQRKDLSFQLMASGAAEAPKLLELKKSGTKNFPHLSRVWNRFFDWNLHLKKKRWKNVYCLKSVGMLGSRSQKNSDIYALIFIIHGSFLNWKPTATQGMANGAHTNSQFHCKNLRVATHNHTKGGQQSSMFVRCSSPDTKDTVNLGAAISAPERCWPKCSNSQVVFGQACLLRQPIIITNKMDFKIFMMWSSARSSCMFLSQYQILGERFKCHSISWGLNDSFSGHFHWQFDGWTANCCGLLKFHSCPSGHDIKTVENRNPWMALEVPNREKLRCMKICRCFFSWKTAPQLDPLQVSPQSPSFFHKSLMP